jgi:DNA-binding XRE family transcriptional regulator
MPANSLLKKLREEAKLRQEDVAAWIDSSRTNYVRKESGGYNTTIQELETLLKNYKKYLPPNRLIGIILEVFELDRSWTPKQEENASDMKYADELIAQLKAENKRLLETISELKQQIAAINLPFDKQQNGIG